MPRPAPLTVAEETAWRSLARLMIALPRAIDDDMTLRGGISLTNYVVLMRLSEAPGRTLRMGTWPTGRCSRPAGSPGSSRPWSTEDS